jgi:putative DNA primase/helicase
MHKDGEEVRWEVDGEPAKVDGEELQRQVAVIAAYSLLARYWPPEKGGHHDAAKVVGGFLARLGHAPPIVRSHVSGIGKAAGSSRWRELARTAKDAADAFAAGKNTYGLTKLREVFSDEIAGKCVEWLKYDASGEPQPQPPSPGKKPSKPSATEDGIALEFERVHADTFRYVAKNSQWRKWAGNCWRDEDTLHAFDESRKLCCKAGCTKAKTVSAVITLARACRALAATTDQWDSDAMLIGCPTATVDLRTGEARAPERTDYITKAIAVDPAPPGTPHPLWTAFLKKVAAEDEELIGFLQRYTGYCLTAQTVEHVLVFLFGHGANGKGVFAKTVSDIMGDYAITAPMEMFLEQTRSASDRDSPARWRAPRDRARDPEGPLVGRNQNQGADVRRHVDRPLHAAGLFDFDPTHKFLFTGNHKPILRSVDEAFRRRFLLVPFTVQIPKEERDPKLAEKLKPEWPAILRWMIDGCLAWQSQGLGVPKSVRDATDEHLADQDTISQWIEDRLDLTRGPFAFTTTRKLFGSWKAWCAESNLGREPRRHSPTPSKTGALSMIGRSSAAASREWS